MAEYLMAGQESELERLQLQSRVWEPTGERLLAQIGDGSGWRALDVGCGSLGWLRLLSRWTGGGPVVGTDIDPRMTDFANRFVSDQGLPNVEVLVDDLFHTALAPASFDLVHARFELAPIGRADDQIRAYLKLVRPGGWIVLEDPDAASWHFNPDAPALHELIELIQEAFRRGGGDFNAGRSTPDLLRAHGLRPEVRADVLALPPGDPYLGLPLQFSTSLRRRLVTIVGEQDLDALRASAEAELRDETRWGTTFTLIQCWATVDRSNDQDPATAVGDQAHDLQPPQ